MDNIENKIAKEILDNLFKVAPEMEEVLDERHKILKVVNMIGPIGRRVLSTKTGISERIIRKESDILKKNKLLESTFQGMIMTTAGKKILNFLEDLNFILKGLKKYEIKTANILGIKKVVIAPVNSHKYDGETILNFLGKVAADYLVDNIDNDSVVGLTGGTTVESVVEKFNCKKKNFSNVTVVPARGNLGNKIEYQANTLVEILANKIKGNYKLLFTPDNMSEDTTERLQNEPEVKETLGLIDKVDTLVFGVGKADTMMDRRRLSKVEVENIHNKNAVAEAFGYYFNSKGDIVYEINTIGIDLYKFKHVKNLIAVAGGIDKVDAILSICKLDSSLVLITDEEVAKEILRRNEEDENVKSSN